jgi:hypothetical protein
MTSPENISAKQFLGAKVMPKDKYINVAMQMEPKSEATNTASGTKA